MQKLDRVSSYPEGLSGEANNQLRLSSTTGGNCMADILSDTTKTPIDME